MNTHTLSNLFGIIALLMFLIGIFIHHSVTTVIIAACFGLVSYTIHEENKQ